VKLTGKAVSPGIVLGRVYRYAAFQPCVQITHFPPEEADVQLACYRNTVETVRKELQAIHQSLANRDADKAAIFAAHLNILCDNTMDAEICAMISGENLSPDTAVDAVFSRYAQVLEEMEDARIRERAADLRDVKNRFLRVWSEAEERNLSNLSEPVIVVASELLPSDTATLDRSNVLGILEETGGVTSHTAIIAKSYGIPAILGISGLLNAAAHGDYIVMDALRGEVYTDADITPELQDRYRQLRAA
jgi:phosphotransferase system enzyme I (PtsI)